MALREIVGIAMGVLVLAGLSVAITRGGNTAKILDAAGNSFAKVINAATLNGEASS